MDGRKSRQSLGSYAVLIIVTVSVLLLWYFYPSIILFFHQTRYLNSEHADIIAKIGQLGDSYASLAFLLNAAACTFLALQLKLQKDELTASRIAGDEQQVISKRQADLAELQIAAVNKQTDQLVKANELAQYQIYLSFLERHKQIAKDLIDSFGLPHGLRGKAALSELVNRHDFGSTYNENDLFDLVSKYLDNYMSVMQNIHSTKYHIKEMESITPWTLVHVMENASSWFRDEKRSEMIQEKLSEIKCIKSTKRDSGT